MESKIKRVVNIFILCEPPKFLSYRYADLEQYAKDCENWVQEFHNFIRDHRSQDPVTLNVEREYQDVCSFCGSDWETDENGCPLCCDEAIKEWEDQKIVAHKG